MGAQGSKEPLFSSILPGKAGTAPPQLPQAKSGRPLTCSRRTSAPHTPHSLLHCTAWWTGGRGEIWLQV